MEGESMSCYFRHIKDVFADAGVEVTPQNKKEVDRAVHAVVGVEYKDCPAAWRAVKEALAAEGGRDRFVDSLKSEMEGGPPQ